MGILLRYLENNQIRNMTYFAGHTGSIRLRRTTQAGAFRSVINANEVNTNLNRVGFNGSFENLITGDRVQIASTNGAVLSFFTTQGPNNAWAQINAQAQIGTAQQFAAQTAITAFINVNLAGGVRFYTTFERAVNNLPEQAIVLQAMEANTNIPIELTIEDTTFNLVGDVTSYDFQTEREAIDVTTLSDRFRNQYGAGLITGAGSIDALFNNAPNGSKENSLLLMQLIQRVEIGSAFSAQLFLARQNQADSISSVFYSFDAVVQRAGVDLSSNGIINVSIDFLATGEVRLRVGQLLNALVTETGQPLLQTPFAQDLLALEPTD